MWIFTQKGFLSIVRHTDKPNALIVRSRFQGHIEKIFPKAHVIEDAERDYRFRAELSDKAVSELIGKLVLGIDYDNFKNSLDTNDKRYLNCCLDVYISVARNSSEWDLDNFIYCRRETDEG